MGDVTNLFGKSASANLFFHLNFVTLNSELAGRYPFLSFLVGYRHEFQLD